MHNILIKLGVVAVSIVTAVAGYFGIASKHYVTEQVTRVTSQQPVLGASIPTVVTRFQTSLQASITSTANTMTLVAATDAAGNSLSGYYCFTIDEGTSVVEDVCGSASGTAVTSMIRGISPTSGTSSVASLEFAHRRGASVKITDAPQLPILSRILNGNETIPNQLVYDGSVSSSSMSSNLQNVASVAYVNSIGVAGAPNASAVAKGLVQAGTGAQLSLGTSSGSTGALLFAPGSLYSSTSSATILIPVTQSNGKLAQGFLDLSQAFSFTGSVITNATTTLQAISTKPLVIDGLTYNYPAASSTGFMFYTASTSSVSFDQPAGPIAPSRSLGTTYQNTSKHPLMVNITANEGSTCPTQGGYLAVLMSTSTANFITMAAAQAQVYCQNSSVQAVLIPLYMIVPPDYYYQATSTGSASISTWEETQF